MTRTAASMVSASSHAETRKNAVQHDALMTGNTIYLEEPHSGGEIVLWYSADGKAMAGLPSSSLLNGTWSIKDNVSYIFWSYSPKDSCSVLVKREAGMVLLEVGTDRPALGICISRC